VSTGSGTVGFTAPNPVAQADAIRRAVRSAGVDPRTISYVETHGTGTALGDPIEVRGLTLAYGEKSLWDAAVSDGQQACTIGSIKPNIGHLEAGAGVMGLIKVLLQVQRGYLLPSVTSEAPNPQIPFAETPVLDPARAGGEWERPVMTIGGSPAPVPRARAELVRCRRRECPRHRRGTTGQPAIGCDGRETIASPHGFGEVT
jgi:acyl transferase domain-containing protein